MPNIKSAKKRVLIAKERTEANKASKTALKTVIKMLVPRVLTLL